VSIGVVITLLQLLLRGSERTGTQTKEQQRYDEQAPPGASGSVIISFHAGLNIPHCVTCCRFDNPSHITTKTAQAAFTVDIRDIPASKISPALPVIASLKYYADYMDRNNRHWGPFRSHTGLHKKNLAVWYYVS
jgi:hypothetical protein